MSVDVCMFDVVGLPTPQGSKTRMPNGAMLEGGSKEARARHRDWRTTVADKAREQAEQRTGPMDGEIELTVLFRFPMPKSRPKRIREQGSAFKTTMPDLDKLVRSVGDGLTTGGLIVDDARLVRIVASKIETTGWTGAQIVLTNIERNQP